MSDHVDIKLFGKWCYSEIEVGDISLEDYIAVKTKSAQFVPFSSGHFQTKRFRKAKCPIVERLVNSLMMHGRNNGKKILACNIVRHSFEIINLITDKNPIQVLVDAIVNSSPREDATSIGNAGVVRRMAVDVSPLRRVNQAILNMTAGSRQSSYRNVKTISECLAEEIINASKGSSNSYAVKKKDELRVKI
jgi:small subunit ribosomal protein S5e